VRPDWPRQWEIAGASISAKRSLLLEPATSEADRLALAHLLIESGRSAEAATLATTIADQARGCDDRSFSLLSRLDTPAADHALYRAIAAYPKTCPSWALWTRRAVGELSGVQQFSAALDMLRPLATGALATDDDGETFGQLLFWTGEPHQAIGVLAPLLQRQPGRMAGADTLIDAYRATNQSDQAWRVAKTRLSDPQLSPGRRLSLAGLAIDRGALDEAGELAAEARLADPSLTNAAYAIEARALLSARKPVEALEKVGRIPADQLDEAGTLTWLEATRDVHGRRQALQAARGIEARASGWVETLARTALWTAQEDGIDAAASPRARVAARDATRADLLAIEIALAAQKPEEAVRLADGLLSHDTPTSTRERILDLRINGLAAIGRYAEARSELAGLMAMRPDEAALRVRDAVYQARELRASGELARALAVMPDADVLDTNDAVVRAELVQAVQGAPAAEAAWAALAERPDATDMVFLAWSRTAKSAAERQARLRAGQTRFAGHANLDVALAESQIIDGDWPAAAQTATAVLMRDPRIPVAWEVLVSAVAAQPRESVPTTLSTLPPQVFSQEPRTVYRLAERLSSAGASDAAVEQALTWVRTVPPSSEAERIEAKLVEARILASRQRWQGALTALDSLASAEQDPAVRRLRAQVLAWSGRHEEALVAYDAYLKTEPVDLMARREQARTAGWAQKIALSNQLYARLVLDNPDSSAARAEATAKRLMYAGQWLEAARAYRAWLEIEPDDTEARFDLGEVLTAAGHHGEARSLYADLSAETPPHTLAAVANRRLARQARPSGGAFSDRGNSDGYNGQRLLERTDTGGRVILPLFGDTRQILGFSAGTMTVSDGFTPQSGPAMRGSLAVQPTDRLQARAAFGRARPGSLSIWDAAVDLSVLAVDRLYVDAGFLRAPLWENLTTLRDGLTTSGPRAGVRFESPDTSLSLQISSATTGQNHRLVVGGFGSRRVRRGANEIRLLADADRLSWSEADARYFSPAQFVRVNAGAEWQSWVHAPRFRADRKDALVLGYLFGMDSRGAAYHQPRARFAIELKEATIEAHAAWILSDVYTSTEFGFAVRVGG
jgi:tetratricopeptide (TPR) repeat protein